MPLRHDQTDPRLAELLEALSLVTDLARGRHPRRLSRACFLATRLAGDIGVLSAGQTHVYYVTLLRFVGCTATAHEYTKAFGVDQSAVHGRGDMTDPMLGSVAYAVAVQRNAVLPRWTAWVAWVAAVGAAAAVPAAFGGTGFYSQLGPAPALLQGVPGLAWLLVASISMVRRRTMHGAMT